MAVLGATVVGLPALAAVALALRYASGDPVSVDAPRPVPVVVSPSAADTELFVPHTRTPKTVASIEVGGSPSAVASGAGAVWVVARGRVVRIDPSTNRIVARIRAGGPTATSHPCSIAADASGLWVATSSGGVSRIDPATNRLAGRPIELGDAGCLAIADGAVWVTQPAEGAIARIDGLTKKVTAELQVEGAPEVVAVGAGAIWVGTTLPSPQGDGAVVKIAPDASRIEPPVLVRGVPKQIVVNGRTVWVATTFGTVLRIDSRTSRLIGAPITIGSSASAGITLGGGHVWAAGVDGVGLKGRLVRLGREQGVVGEPIDLGEAPSGVAYAKRSIWVADAKDGTVSRLIP